MAQTIKPPKGRWAPNNPEKPVENYISCEYGSFVIQIGNQEMLSDRIHKRCQNLEEKIGYLKILSEKNDESAREIITKRRQNLKNELNRCKNEIEKKEFQKKLEWLRPHSDLKTIIERSKELKKKIGPFRHRFRERIDCQELKYLEDLKEETDRTTIGIIRGKLKENTKEIEKKEVEKKLEYLENFLTQKEYYLRRRNLARRYRITIEEEYEKLKEELEYLKNLSSCEVIKRLNELESKYEKSKYEEEVNKKREYLRNIRTLELDEIRILPINSYYRINGRIGDLGLVESNLLRPFTKVPRHKGLVKVYSTNEGKYVRELGSEENKIHVKNSHYDDILMTIKRYQYKESLLKGKELRDERREQRKKQIEKLGDFVTRHDNDPSINTNLERKKDRLNQLIVEDKLIDSIEEGKKFKNDKVVWKEERQKKLSELIKQIDECEDDTEKDDLKQELERLKKRKTLKIIEEYQDDLKKELIDIYRKQRYEKDQVNLSGFYTWRVNRVLRETSERVFIDDIEHRVVICTVRCKDENETVELPGLSMLKLEGQAKYNFGWFIKGNELEFFEEKQEKELNEFGWNKDIVCEVICKSKRRRYPDFQLEELRRDDQGKKKWINLSEKWRTYISSESIGVSISIPSYKKFFLKPRPPRGFFQYPEINNNPIRNYLFYGVKGDGLDRNGFALYDHNVSASFPSHEKRGLMLVKEIYFTIIDYYNKIEGERNSSRVESELCLPFHRRPAHESRCRLWSNKERRYVNKKNQSFNDVLKSLAQMESSIENSAGGLEQPLKHYKVIICSLRYRNEDNEVHLPGLSMIILGDKARDQFNGFVSKNLDIYRTREIIGKFYDPGPSTQDEVVKSIGKVSWTEFKNEIRKIIVSEVNPQKFKLEEGDAYFEFSDENKHYSNNEDKTKWQNYIKGKVGKKVRRKITEMSLRTLRWAFFVSVLSSIMGILVDWKGFWNLLVDIFK